MMNDLTLVIPAKFESESLPLVLTEIKNLKCKKLIVLEESDLDTINAAKKFDCELLFGRWNLNFPGLNAFGVGSGSGTATCGGL